MIEEANGHAGLLAKKEDKKLKSYQAILKDMKGIIAITSKHKKPRPNKPVTDQGPRYMQPVIQGTSMSPPVKRLKPMMTMKDLSQQDNQEKVKIKGNSSLFLATSANLIKAKHRFLNLLRPKPLQIPRRSKTSDHSKSRTIDQTMIFDRKVRKRPQFSDRRLMNAYRLLFEYKRLHYQLERVIEDERYSLVYKGIDHMKKKLLARTLTDLIDYLLKVIQKREDAARQFKTDDNFEKQVVPDYLIPPERLDETRNEFSIDEYHQFEKIFDKYDEYVSDLRIVVEDCTSPRTKGKKLELEQRIEKISEDFYRSDLFIKSFDYQANKSKRKTNFKTMNSESPFESKITNVMDRILVKQATQILRKEEKDLFLTFDPQGNPEVVEEQSPKKRNSNEIIEMKALGNTQSLESSYISEEPANCMPNKVSLRILATESASQDGGSSIRRHVKDMIRNNTSGSLQDLEFFERMKTRGFHVEYKYKLKNKNIPTNKRHKIDDLFFDDYVIENAKSTLFTRPIKKRFAGIKSENEQKVILDLEKQTEENKSHFIDPSMNKFFVLVPKKVKPWNQSKQKSTKEVILSSENKQTMKEKAPLLEKGRIAIKEYQDLFEKKLQCVPSCSNSFTLGEYFSQHLEKENELKPSGIKVKEMSNFKKEFWEGIPSQPTIKHFRSQQVRLSQPRATKNNYRMSHKRSSSESFTDKSSLKHSRQRISMVNINNDNVGKLNPNKDEKKFQEMGKQVKNLSKSCSKIFDGDDQQLKTYLAIDRKENLQNGRSALWQLRRNASFSKSKRNVS